jgi:hypothetical protein
MASAHQVPVAPHDATGPVNIFACAQICMSAPNAMIMEHVRPFFLTWYNDYVEPNLPIEHGWLYAPQEPGIGTRLKASVRERKDVIIRVTDESKAIPGMHDEGWRGWDGFSPEMKAEMDDIWRFRKVNAEAPEGRV